MNIANKPVERQKVKKHHGKCYACGRKVEWVALSAVGPITCGIDVSCPNQGGRCFVKVSHPELASE